MTATRLSPIRIEKPWGRRDLGASFGVVPEGEPPVGEIWFTGAEAADHALLVKYLFTSERLSIQVHPDDEQARASGFGGGKEEAWIILDADPDAVIGLGTVRTLSHEELRAAAMDGSIERLMHWQPVKAGDIIAVPAGTVHAIGAGITLIEVQQNIDLTYRIYDYGRPRELHLDAGIAVSRAEPFVIDARIVPLGGECLSLVQGGKFVVEQWGWNGARTLALPPGVEGWLIPVVGRGTIDAYPWQGGECWHVSDSVAISVESGADLLFAYCGAEPLRLFASS